MGFLARILAIFAMLWAGALSATAMDGPTQSAPSAQAKGADKAAATGEKAAPATVQAYEAGIKAYQDGKTDLAIRALGKALNGGGLESPKMAQALYYRGLAYRKKGKPGLAISDLTSAIWLKDGLNYTDQQAAMSARIAAYREAGISDIPQLPSANVMMASPTAASSSGWQTAMANPSGPPSGALDATGPQYAPSAPSPQPQSSSGGGITGFFNNVTNSVTSLFGGGSSSTPNDNDGAVTTASLSAPNNNAATSAASWSGNTQVAVNTSHNHVSSAATPSFVTEVAATMPDRNASTAKSPSGKYRLQIASVRSRVEADNLAHRLVSEYGSELGARAPVVDEAVIGSMGTFYRVRVGPYGNASEPQKLCGKLQPNGFDCLVVTQ